MRTLLAALAAAITLAAPLSATAEEQQVTQHLAMTEGEPVTVGLAIALMQFDTAQANGDRAALERLVADNYLLIGGDGAIQNKAQFIADITSPAFDMDPFTVEEMRVRMFGPNTAVVTGRAQLTGTSNGNRFSVNLRFTDVWAQRNGQWQVVSAQTTRVE